MGVGVNFKFKQESIAALTVVAMFLEPIIEAALGIVSPHVPARVWIVLRQHDGLFIGAMRTA